MNTAHTPGPWILGTQDHAAYLITGPRGSMPYIACIPASRGLEVEANARLIAAAPDLLAALQDLRALHWDWFRGSAYVTVEFEKQNKAAIAKASAAIAKATSA